MRDMVAAAEGGNPKAESALQMFVHRLVSYIGAYYTILGGADAVVFTGGIGENSVVVRRRVMSQLACLGCRPDERRNRRSVGRAAVVSAAGSRLAAIVMPTNEELMIARETARVWEGLSDAAPAPGRRKRGTSQR
jgi:acetate kinase